MELIVHQNPECVERGINPFDHGSALHTDMWKTEGLKQVIDEHKFDLCFGGARRDEEKSRAKERIFSVRSPQHQWDPKRQRPELWDIYNARRSPGRDAARVPDLQLDRTRRVAVHPSRADPDRAAVPRRRHGPVVDRDGVLIMVDDDRFRFDDGEVPEMRTVRFRTLGCYPLSGAIESDADITDRRHPGDAARHHLRTPRPHHRFRRRGVHGEEEAGGLLLMAHASELIADDIEAYLHSHQHK